MDPSFKLNSYIFFKIDPIQEKRLMESLCQTYGAYKIPEDIWRQDLMQLPSSIRSADCIACFITGPMPTITASIGITTIDIIRKEYNPQKYEPDYNVYVHCMIKGIDGSFYISEPIKPDYHWATYKKLEKIYGYKL